MPSGNTDVNHVNVREKLYKYGLICGILSLGFAFVTETISINMIFHTIGPILYAGIFSSGIAYVLQAIGQKHVEPTVAAIINWHNCKALLLTLMDEKI